MSAAPILIAKSAIEGFSIATTMVKSLTRSMSSMVGREIVRGVLGSFFGGRKR